jgi:predicted ribosome quality control (RQC) complex YloA/Tae2 family protein
MDEGRRILSILRKMTYRGSRMAPGEEYIYHSAQRDPRTISQEELSALLATSGQDLVRTLVRALNMSGTYGEEVCLQAGLDKNRQAAGLEVSEIDRLHLALAEVFSAKGLEPQIVLKDGDPLDVLPWPLRVYEGLEKRRFANFSEALDAFFMEEVGEAEESPIDRRIELQRRAIEEFAIKEKEMIQAGELIYQRYGEIEEILRAISEGRARGFSYPQIWERISASGLPQARVVRSLDSRGIICLDLDGGELELDARLTVPQNAERYYSEAKEMARKARGARAALEATERLRAEKAAPRRTRSPVRRRKPKWYERFRWFNSTDGLLVIGGRDAETNEEVYSKYLEKRDLALHTDAPGAPLTVIKSLGGVVPETTVREAAQFAVSYSSIWKGGFATGDCYLVGAEQVTKTPEPGEFLRKGAFVIRGERRYLRDVSVGIAVGIAEGMLIGGPVSAILPRADPAVEIEPGELSPDDLAKRIYRFFSEKVDDRAYVKVVASVDRIVQFLPPGGSRIKG